LEAFNKYSSITPKTKRKSAKKDIQFQCESLKGAYSICSGIAVHAGIHNMNLKLQARRYSTLIPSIVDVLENYNILTSPTMIWLKTNMIIPAEPTDGELERMIAELEKRLKEEKERHLKALNELEQLNIVNINRIKATGEYVKNDKGIFKRVMSKNEGYADAAPAYNLSENGSLIEIDMQEYLRKYDSL
jgi:hypothetical protein